jgi:hypothetical protein
VDLGIDNRHRGQLLCASVPNPKFAFRGDLLANFGFEMTLEIYDSSVILVQKVSSRTRGDQEENFQTTTLAKFGQSSRRVSRGQRRRALARYAHQ